MEILAQRQSKTFIMPKNSTRDGERKIDKMNYWFLKHHVTSADRSFISKLFTNIQGFFPAHNHTLE